MRTLMAMNEVGLLAAFVPEWEHIVCRWQHVLYHTYTVDVHSIFLVEELRRLIAERGDVDERTERARAELERERMQECTFAPQTNEASVELLLSRAAERGALGYQEGGYAAKKAEQGYARK